MLHCRGKAGARFGVGRKVAVGAVHQFGFACFGKSHEFARDAAADLAGVGFYGTVIKAGAFADVAIGNAHAVVRFLQRFLAGMEAVSVLHDEFAATQQTEARANFITELGLDLIERDRQLTIRTKLVAHDCGDELFVRGPKAEAVIVAIAQAHKLRAVIVPAA